MNWRVAKHGEMGAGGRVDGRVAKHGRRGACGTSGGRDKHGFGCRTGTDGGVRVASMASDAGRRRAAGAWPARLHGARAE